MSKVIKRIKKGVKRIGRALKKVVKGIVKVGKKIVKGIGKVVGKLGPIGTIAIAFIAPYAIGAMAGMGGWVGALGKGIQAVGSAVAAPFKMAGQVIGKGISALGQATGSQAFQTVTNQIASTFGYKGGDLASGFAEIKNSVAGQWDSAFGTSLSPKPPMVEGEFVFGTQAPTQAAPAEAFQFDVSGVDKFATAPNVSLLTDPVTMMEGVGVDNSTFKGLSAAEAQSFAEYQPKSSLLDRVKEGLSSLPTPGFSPSSIPTPLDTSGYGLESAQAGGDTSGPGALGSSFYAQNLTGLTPTEELAKRMASLMGRVN